MDKCPNCSSAEYLFRLGIIATSGVMRNEVCCLRCKIVYREVATVTKNDTMRATFCKSRGKMNKAQLIALKENDRNLYAAWLSILDHLETVTNDQLKHNDEYSEVACHFLYIARQLLRFLGETLKERINRLNEWLSKER